MKTPPGEKRVALAVLVAAFLLQTVLVYSDEPTGPMGDQAVRGRRIWQRNGCQVCHQIYGQGGFLGPDLTNAASRVDSIRIHSLLTVGSGQMPAFHLADADIADVRAFLRAIDRPDLGRGQLRLGAGDRRPWDRFDDAVAARVNAAAARGWTAIRSGTCVACHQPLAASPVGAPDLSLAAERLGTDGLRAVLTEGRPTLGMPPPGLDPDTVADVIAFLEWLAAERPVVAEAFAASAPDRAIDWRAVPWWEYR